MHQIRFGAPLRPIRDNKTRAGVLMAKAPDLDHALRRHAAHYLTIAKTHRLDFRALDIDTANIDAALEYCSHEQDWTSVAEFVTALADFWVSKGLWELFLGHGRALLGVRQRLSSGADPRNPLDSIDSNSWFYIIGRMAEVEENRGNGPEALVLYRQQVRSVDTSTPANEGMVVEILKRAARLAARYEQPHEAKHLLDQALELARLRGARKEEIEVLLELAAFWKGFGDLETADSWCSAGIEISRSIGYTGALIELLILHGTIRRQQRLNADAKRCYQLALETALSAGDQHKVDQLKTLLAELESISARRVFISYNHHDRPFVKRLATDMKTLGLSVWWDEWEIKVGDSIVQKVSEGIEGSAFLLVILSPDSVNAPWVQRELGSALMKQLSTDRSISVLPVLVAKCDVPALIRDLKWAEFRDDYRTGIQALLDVLKPGSDVTEIDDKS